ncbi:MAG: insulinase family protein [Spirochaetes bacterium]|nr:insulinase family protein [Spirochaetota bacterium]
MRLLVLLTAFFCWASVYAADLAAEKFNVSEFQKTIEAKIQKRTLSNGLRVIAMRQTSSPTIACYLKIGVGSANEPFDQSGTAHFLEHLLFKGTPTMGTTNYKDEKVYLEQIEADGERIDSLERTLLNPLLTADERAKIAARMKVLENRLERWQKSAQKFVISEEDSQAYSLAGQMGYNAYTTTDVTNYQIKLPAHRLEMWAELESNRFLDPVLREFYPERKVIKEERRMRYDSRPTSLLYELFLKTAFGMSPYGKPVIGFEKSMHRLRLKETREFFDTNYVPSRMVIAIVGDIEFEKTFAIMEKYFGRIKARRTPEFPPTVYEPQKGRRIAYLEAKNSPAMITGWARPSVLHPDDRAFEVLARLLGDGQTSRLVNRLVIRDKLTGDVKVGSSTPGDKLDTQFTIFADVFDAASYAAIEKGIAEELDRLKNEGPSAEELQKIKNRYIAELVHTLQQNAGLADTLSYYDLIMQDYRKMFSAIEEVEQVDAAKIKALVAKYFTETQNTTVYLKPTGK